MQTVRMILVGGFLGAGKTTLLWEAARRLMKRGRRVGLITNDQAPDLVDTTLLVAAGLDVREVAGSCFCCNFNGLIAAADALKHDVNADVLFAEPVGSCTDLSATILQPLKDHFAQAFVPSPLSVLADPERLDDLLRGGNAGLSRGAAYIYRMQLEEADLIVINKADLLATEKRDALREQVMGRFPRARVRMLSALTGEGVDAWLDEVLAGGPAGTHIAEVDYDVYAAGEASLGWLNAEVFLSAGDDGVDWTAFCQALLEGLREEAQKAGAVVGHVKAHLSAGKGSYTANLTRTEGTVSLRGEAGRAPEATLILNARVEMPPEELERIVRRTLAHLAGAAIAVDVRDLRSFRPGRPNPTHRYTHTIDGTQAR
jgi:Ni2+-binding GTPase involved in maturation of urease and hydrogenase